MKAKAKSSSKAKGKLQDLKPRKNPKGGAKSVDRGSSLNRSSSLDGVNLNHNETFLRDR